MCRSGDSGVLEEAWAVLRRLQEAELLADEHGVLAVVLRLLLGEDLVGGEALRCLGGDAILAEKVHDAIRGLSSLTEPVLDAVLLDANLLEPVPVRDGVVGAHDVHKFTVTRRLGVRGDDAEKRLVAAAEALQAEADGHPGGRWRRGGGGGGGGGGRELTFCRCKLLRFSSPS